MPSSARSGSWPAVIAAVAVRPALWLTALGQIRRLAPPGWWRRAPFAPVPDRAYVRFRIATQYGGGRAPESDPVGAPPAADVVEYLVWCRSLGSAAGAARRSGDRHRR